MENRLEFKIALWVTSITAASIYPAISNAVSSGNWYWWGGLALCVVGWRCWFYETVNLYENKPLPIVKEEEDGKDGD